MGSEAFMTYEDRDDSFYTRHKKPILAVLVVGWILAIIFLALGLAGVLNPVKPTPAPATTTRATAVTTPGVTTSVSTQTSPNTDGSPSPTSSDSPVPGQSSSISPSTDVPAETSTSVPGQTTSTTAANTGSTTTELVHPPPGTTNGPTDGSSSASPATSVSSTSESTSETPTQSSSVTTASTSGQTISSTEANTGATSTDLVHPPPETTTGPTDGTPATATQTAATTSVGSTGPTEATEFTLPTGAPLPIPVDSERRVECLPDRPNVSQRECLMKGCNYYEDAASNGSKCFVDPVKSGYMFRIANISNGIRELALTQKATGAQLYSEPFRQPRVQLDFRSKSVFHFKIFDAANPRYEVPLPLNITTDPPGTPSMYNYFGASLDVKDIRVLRADSRSFVWDMSPGGLYLEDQYLQISTLLGSPDCYGFGDNRHPNLRHRFDGRTWPLFSRDEPPIRPNQTDNTYGVHPFYMCMEEDGKAHGVFLLNSNAMEYQFHGSEKTSVLTIRTMGGILDFYIFMGPTPENVIQQYTSLTGRSFMPPYWALGFQISRWGFEDLDDVKRIVNRNLDAKIPLEAVYGDIDYMAYRQDFTIDPEKYAGLPAYVDELHDKNMRYVIILDPAIHVDAATKHPQMDYRPYTDGVARDVFIKWPANITGGVDGVLGDSIGENHIMLGKVWPDGRTAFPDFFKNETKDWWTYWINDLYMHQSLKFDAIWIDMNEVSSWDTNRDPQTGWYCNKPDVMPGNHTCFALQCPKNSHLELPAYRSMAARHWDANGTEAMLSDKTICMIGQSTGKNGQIYNQYDVHNLYGWSQAEVTYRAAQEVRGERSFVFSRSTYPGGQQYVGHWLGDNAANYDEMRYSIIGMLEYSMFGYAYVGADICGFHGNTTVELCALWHALGAFYPFARNHNEQHQNDQDPAFHPAVAHVARTALKLRYTFLPYLYTLFYRAHVYGETVARPLHHVYPEDARTRGIDDQFFWGNALMISPIVHRAYDRTIYIPEKRMYNIYDGKAEDDVVAFDGSWEELALDEDWDNTTELTERYSRFVPLHLRPGFIIPTQDPAMTTTESRSNPFRLLITIDQDKPTAEGELFWDDGTSIDAYENGKYYLARFSYDNNASPDDGLQRFFNYTVVHNDGPDMGKMKIEELRLYTNVDRAYFDRLQFVVRTDFGIRPSVLCAEWKDEGYFSILGPFEMDESFTIQIYRYVDERPRTRIDCAPDFPNVRQCDCNQRGCIWAGLFDNEEGGPVCVYPAMSELRTGYRALTAAGGEHPPQTYYGTSRPLTVTLGLLQPNFALRPNSYQRLQLQITPVSAEILRISFVPGEERDDPAGNYTVPCFLAPWSCNISPTDSVTQTRYSYEVDNTNAGRPTFLRVKRGDRSGPVIWSTDVGALIYAHQYREITTRVASEYIYGAGEHTHNSFKHDLGYKTWGLWAHDEPPGGRRNMYGVHPYVMVVEDNKGNAFGSLLLNSNAMEMAFTPTPAITYRTTGGQLDFFLFVGDSPSEVNQIYTSFIGRPVLPPFWALGYQLSRGGYNNFQNMLGAVEQTINAGIPLDVFYGDIDYLADLTNFGVNETAFGELPDYVQRKLEQGVRFVSVVDPVVPASLNNSAFQRALQRRDVFVRWPQGYVDTNNQSYATYDPSQPPYLLGHVYPRAKVVFTDFFNPSGREWWGNEIETYHQTINFSALWLDMNEPTNFGTNGDDVWYTYSPEYSWSLQCDNSSALERPPYTPRFVQSGQFKRLSERTLCMDAVQSDGGNTYSHYNVHSLYGHSQIEPSLRAVQTATGQRSFVLSRSTFVGSGARSGHWLGDNQASWDHMRQSIIGMLEFNLFGIPYVGADICGYYNDTTPELCARWHQLGAFYPFSRNHNTRDTIDQDPQALGGRVVRAAKAAMDRRYRLLPYLYTLFAEVNMNGGSVARSLMEVFPKDMGARDIDRQFMWGDCLLVTPVLTQGMESVTGYFPPGEWYDWVTGLETNSVAGGLTKILSATEEEMIPVHVRGGCIIPTQGPGGRNTQESLTKEYTLGIATTRERGRDTATGSLFWDGGLNVRDRESNSTDFFVTFEYELKLGETTDDSSYNVTGTVMITPTNRESVWGQQLPPIVMIIVTGVPNITSINYATIVTNGEDPVPLDISTQVDYNAEHKVLRISGLNIALTNNTIITFYNNFEYPEPESPDQEALRIDCLPDLTEVDPRQCLAKGCVPYVDRNGTQKCSIDPVATGYTLSRGTVPSKDSRNILTYELQPKPATRQLYSQPFVRPRVRLDQTAKSMMHFKISDASSRYEVPVPMNDYQDPADMNRQYRLVIGDEFNNRDIRNLKIVRDSTGTAVWDMGLGGLYLEDQYLQITTKLSSPDCYGFGDNRHPTLKHQMDGRTWPMFARDEPPNTPDKALNLYGVHPFYMCTEADGNAHGVFLLNSNAMEYKFHNSIVNPALTLRSIGGVLDFYIFMGPTPENVVEQYTRLTGRSFMPPYWALGFQISRWGFEDLDHVKSVVDRNMAARIPLDAVYGDIDYMAYQQDFTIDQENYAGLPAYVDELHEKGMRYVIILDPAIHADAAIKHPQLPEYRPYTDGLSRDIFIKWPANIRPETSDILPESVGPNRIILGKVWPEGRVAYPDFFRTETQAWWQDWIRDVYTNQSLKFDAIWLDMNEPSSWGTNKPANESFFCGFPTGEFDNHTCYTLQCPKMNKLETPPYRPMAVRAYDPDGMLSDKTICMTAQSRGRDGRVYNQYDIHNLYGWSQAEVTYRAAQTIRNERSFVFSRSTYPGAQQYVGHWLGDNEANFEDMRHSIIGMLEYSMFGFSYTGADICGFWANTSPELCTKWSALGAFYPFSRNHNSKGSIDQDPAYHPAVAHVARTTLNIRYTFLPYLYTLFYRAHMYGETVARPLHHVYPQDERARSTDDQFFWGPALMITPVIDNSTDRDVYIPSERMYDYFDGYAEEANLMVPLGSSWEVLLEGWLNYTSNITIDPSKSANKYVGLHLRPGFIIPTQDPALTTVESRKNPFRLIITVDRDTPTADGELFWDDGVGTSTIDSGSHYLAKFSYDNTADRRTFNYTVLQAGMDMTNMSIAELRIYTNVEQTYFENLRFVIRSGAGFPRLTVLCAEWKYNVDRSRHYFSILGPFEMSESFTIQLYNFKDERKRTMIDCAPDIDNVRECDCLNRACVWNGRGPGTNPGEPTCVYPEDYVLGYLWDNEDGEEEEAPSSNASLTRTLTLQNENFANRRGAYQKVRLQVTPVTDFILRITFAPASDNDDPAGNYTVPCSMAPWSCNITPRTERPWYSYEITDSGTTTSVQVRRRDHGSWPAEDGPVIWSTEVGAMVFAHQYREITTKLASDYVYGSGENTHDSFRRDMDYQTYGMFARDQRPGNRTNLYGVHPYVMVLDDDEEGQAYGVLMLNSNAMEMAFTPTPAITYRTTGGHLDFFLIVGNEPTHVNQLYHRLIGTPFLPPYWALGFQLSRGGWGTYQNMADAVDRTINAQIPLDVFYGDIDYLANQTNFLLNEDTFSELPDYVQRKLVQGVRFVTVVDPVVPASLDNEAFQRALQRRDVFVRWPQGYVDTNNQSYASIDPSQPPYILGHVYPKAKVVFTDFLHPSGQEWWQDELERFHMTINFSAVWLDMNEPTNFGTNDDDVWYEYSPVHPWALRCSNDSALERPQYTPRAVETGLVNRLSQKTICMDAVQSDGESTYSHYNVHSLYGHSQIQATHLAMQNMTGQRSFVLSRSTFPGSGAKAGHWLGDNAATWEQMEQSIIGMLDFNLFGIPYVGADICGYHEDASEELCARWHQLGAFYPFSRNHNTRGTIDQDPVMMGDVVRQAAKTAMDRRYRLLPFLYSWFSLVSATGGTVVQSLMEDYPQDPIARDIHKQFLWGHCLLVTPVLTPNASTVAAYFPEGQWYDYVTGEMTTANSSGLYKALPAPIDEMIPLHIKGGCIVPLQGTGRNTAESLRTNYTLGIASSHSEHSGRTNHEARGYIVWDGGEAIREENEVREESFVAVFAYQLDNPPSDSVNTSSQEGFLDIETYNGNSTFAQDMPRIETILIAGFPDVEPMIYIEYNPRDGGPVQYFDVDGHMNYSNDTQVLSLYDVHIPINRRATIRFRNFGDPNPSPDSTTLTPEETTES